ncbi:MAG: ABC transporter ATP-binding protein [Geminicoccaceae bacterium]
MADREEGASSGDWTLIRRLLRENGSAFRGGRYAVALLCMAVAALLTGASVGLLRFVVDGIFYQRADLLVVLPLAIAALFIVRGLAAYSSAAAFAKIGNGVVANLQKRLADKVLAMPVRTLEAIQAGDLLARMSSHTIAARDVLDRVANGLVRDTLTFVVLVGIMAWQNPLLSLVVLLVAPPAVLGTRRLALRAKRAAHHAFRVIGEVGQFVQETAVGIRDVRAYNLEDNLRARFARRAAEVERRSNRVASAAALVSPLMEIIAGIVVAAILLLAAAAASENGTPPGALVAFLTAALLAYEPGLRLARLNVQVAGRLPGVRAIYDILDRPNPPQRPGLPPLAAGPGEVVFDAVDFAYDERPLFRGLSFIAEAGKVTALVGPSGGGKSTVIALVARLLEPADGRILIDGQDVAAVDPVSVRAAMALVSQDLRFFSGTVRENIRFGRLDATDREVEAAAEAALADAFIRALPNGYDTELGEGAGRLSGGQRQRLAIARALVRDARIVLLDEATSALDTESEALVQAALEHLTRGRTTVVIAHRLSTVRHADKVIVFEDGAIAEEGTHGTLLALGGRYATFHHLQFGPRPVR